MCEGGNEGWYGGGMCEVGMRGGTEERCVRWE